MPTGSAGETETASCRTRSMAAQGLLRIAVTNNRAEVEHLPRGLSPAAGTLRSEPARASDRWRHFGLTTLHNIVARGDMTPEERVAFATAVLDRGARLNVRDRLLNTPPLG
jgi:hypothetical protein